MSFTFQHVPRPTRRERQRIRAIDHATFAAEFRHRFRKLMRGVHAGSRLLYVGRVEAEPNQIVSIAILARLSGTTAVYGEYFATDPAVQNQGIGRDIFTFLTAHLGAELGLDALVFDAEVPETDAPDDIDRRRLRYHERLGARRVPQMAHYRIPDEDEEVPMCLMWLPLGERTALPDATEIAAWVRGVYRTNGYKRALGERVIAELDAV